MYEKGVDPHPPTGGERVATGGLGGGGAEGGEGDGKGVDDGEEDGKGVEEAGGGGLGDIGKRAMGMMLLDSIPTPTPPCYTLEQPLREVTYTIHLAPLARMCITKFIYSSDRSIYREGLLVTTVLLFAFHLSKLVYVIYGLYASSNSVTLLKRHQTLEDGNRAAGYTIVQERTRSGPMPMRKSTTWTQLQTGTLSCGEIQNDRKDHGKQLDSTVVEPQWQGIGASINLLPVAVQERYLGTEDDDNCHTQNPRKQSIHTYIYTKTTIPPGFNNSTKCLQRIHRLVRRNDDSGSATVPPQAATFITSRTQLLLSSTMTGLVGGISQCTRP
ncbi:hypothetical protein BDZ91DRAFT_765157 [Kalaharituber pfeilii]|nr:hypothetical protein BDZ91DRAFT_765157 [Kalaharituber pfeilii]